VFGAMEGEHNYQIRCDEFCISLWRVGEGMNRVLIHDSCLKFSKIDGGI